MNKYLITLSAVALSLGATHAAEEMSSLNGGATIPPTVPTVGLAIVVPVGSDGAIPDTAVAPTPTGVGSSCSAQTSEIDGSKEESFRYYYIGTTSYRPIIPNILNGEGLF